MAAGGKTEYVRAMKAHRIIFAVAAALVAATFDAQEVPFDQLPGAVKRTLNQAADGNPVKRVTRVTEANRTFYLAEVEKNNALNPRFRIAEDGELVPEPSVATTIDGFPLTVTPTTQAGGDNAMIPLTDLPQAVQRTIRNEARGREIGDIDRESWHGRTVYEIEFRAAGRNPQLHVAEDGSIVRGEKEPAWLGDFLLGTQLSDTPSAVQAAIQREAAGRVIHDIDIERRSGTVIYEVEIKDPQSGVFQLHIAPDGQILKDSRPGAPQSPR